MKNHGGAVAVYSEPGKGTAFHFTCQHTKELPRKLSRSCPKKNFVVTANGSRGGRSYARNPAFQPATQDELIW